VAEVLRRLLLDVSLRAEEVKAHAILYAGGYINIDIVPEKPDGR
jgi:hypothetical protein